MLRAGHDDVRWIDVEGRHLDQDHTAHGPNRFRDDVVAAGRRITDAATAGDARAACSMLSERCASFCAHRCCPYGVAEWTGQIEALADLAIPGYGDGGPWYVGRPLLVTENDERAAAL